MESDSEDADAPGRVLDHGQDVSLGAVEQVDAEEVAGQDRFGLEAQELRPCWPGPPRRGVSRGYDSRHVQPVASWMGIAWTSDSQPGPLGRVGLIVKGGRASMVARACRCKGPFVTMCNSGRPRFAKRKPLSAEIAS